MDIFFFSFISKITTLKWSLSARAVGMKRNELGHELEHDWFSFWDFVIAPLRARMKRSHHLLFRGFARSSGNEVERHAEASRLRSIKYDFI